MRGRGSRASIHLAKRVVGRSWTCGWPSRPPQPILILVSDTKSRLAPRDLRRRAQANASRGVVVRAVAGAEPAAVVAFGIPHRLTLGDAAEVRADTDQHQPVLFALLGAVVVGGRRLLGSASLRALRSLRSASLTARAAFTSSALRLRMNTGLPRHDTVMAWPSFTGDRSTSMEASACVETSGSIWLMNGHSATAAPTPAKACAAMTMKSRRLGASAE